MEINVETVDNIKVIELAGELDSSTARAAEDTIIPLADNFDRILLDMSRVTYMSSAGLRMLLLIYRRISSKPGNVILVGLNDDVKDVMAITGFLDFFTIYDTRSAGIDALH
jgi:anti-sigma B factor antagonist